MIDEIIMATTDVISEALTRGGMIAATIDVTIMHMRDVMIVATNGVMSMHTNGVMIEGMTGAMHMRDVMIEDMMTSDTTLVLKHHVMTDTVILVIIAAVLAMWIPAPGTTSVETTGAGKCFYFARVAPHACLQGRVHQDCNSRVTIYT